MDSSADKPEELKDDGTTNPVAEILEELLDMFDMIHKAGFIKTGRAGPKGVGYTFETLIGIEENNSPQPDYKGIEIKTHRGDRPSDCAVKRDFFLKEPEWIDDHTDTVHRVRAYGYVDDNNRNALYSTVSTRVNSHGFQLFVDDDNREVILLKDSNPIGYWTFDMLEQRLFEKHRDTVFIAVQCRGQGAEEEFWYRSLLYCTTPSVERFVQLIREGDVMVELRMRDGEGRTNHGCGWRIKGNRLKDRYRTVQRLR